MPSYTYKDGELVEIPDVVITESCELSEPITVTVVIKAGAHVVSLAELTGSVNVESGASLDAKGHVMGTVNVAAHGEATFHQQASGTLNISQGGRVRLAETCVALGTMNIDGELVNEGVRGVQVHGTGTVEDRPGSTVRQPDETWPDGTVVYRG
ncbi:hypothetical protein E7Z53_17200 [Kocuria salina]|uniref:hypothetical protein n=1 Tax=Kocuria salina TaxID=1929416 RepID=UPI0015934D7C|nr:hypothetical protein [Kocuria salina]NVC25162.1 hypothetical protein [Kocuria salina]